MAGCPIGKSCLCRSLSRYLLCRRRNWLVVCLTLLSQWFMPIPIDAIRNEIQIVSDCICSGQLIQITCSVVGLGSTLWSGSTFNCPLLENEISLQHSDFAANSAVGECNGITARGLGVSGQNCYLSQLTLVSSNGQTVMCSYNNGLTLNIVDRPVIVNFTTEPFRAPMNARLTRVNSQLREFTFIWDRVESTCPSLEYRVNSTGCGTCSSSSTSNTTTCMEYDITRDQLCTFTVWTVICDDLVSVRNTSIQVPLKVPDKPSFMRIVPSYSFENRSIVRLNTSFSQNSSNFYISDEIEGSDTLYTVTYTNQDGDSCVSVDIFTSSSFCRKGICQYIFNTSSATCQLPAPSRLVATLRASNVFGEGPTSDVVNIDTNNNIVNVQFDEGSSMIICELSEPGVITVFCSIEYAQEGTTDDVRQRQGQLADAAVNRVEIDLPNLSRSTTYTFVVTAITGNKTINIEGSFTTSGGSNILGSGAIAGIVISIIIPIILLIIVSLVIILFVYHYYNRKKQSATSKLD